MGIPDHLTCLLRNMYAGKEATVRTGHGTTDWFQIGKGVKDKLEFRITKYRLLSIKQINNRNLLYSTGNYNIFNIL